MGAKTEVLQKRPFRLVVDDPNNADATLGFAWCLNKGTIEHLQEKEIRNPYLLVVVAQVHGTRKDPAYTEVERLLLPLDQGMEYIEFPRPGKFVIGATIVWCHNKTMDRERSEARKRLSRVLSKKSDATFVDHHSGFCFDNETLLDYLRCLTVFLTHNDKTCAEEIRVNVSADLFAKKPSQRLWWWTNLWFEPIPRNECLWRRRFFIAFTIQPFFVGLWILIKAIICLFYGGWLLLTGRRYVSLKPIIHPFIHFIKNIDDSIYFSEFTRRYGGEYNDEETHTRVGNSQYYTRARKDGTKHSVPWRILTTPWHWLLAAAIGYGSFLISGSLSTWLGISRLTATFTPLGVIPLIILIILLIRLAVWIIGRGIPFLYWKIAAVILTPERQEARAEKEAEKKARKEAKRRKSERKRKEEDAQASARYYEERLEPITCDGPTKASVDALPPSHQTVYLRFKALKTRVCRPFAR